MTQDEISRNDIIEMAKKSNLLGVIDCFHYTGRQTWVEEATAFAKLVRNDYSNKHAQLWLKRIDEAVKAERKECAKLCDEHHWFWYMGDNSGPKECAELIRARGEAE